MDTAERDCATTTCPSAATEEERMRGRLNAYRHVEAVVVRDPDGPVDVRVFIDGVEASITEFTIDAGAGWCWADWTRCRNQNLAAAFASARQALLAVYADPPGGSYIADRGDAQWLDGINNSDNR